MTPKFVSLYRLAGKAGKNDAADALAICEAVRRPHMRFVPVKDEKQQSMQCLHRTRQGFIEERTASYNRLRGLVAPQSTERLRKLAREHCENLPGRVNQCVDDLLNHLDSIELKAVEYNRILAKIVVRDSRSKSIMKLMGFDVTDIQHPLLNVTSASSAQRPFSSTLAMLVPNRTHTKPQAT